MATTWASLASQVGSISRLLSVGMMLGIIRALGKRLRVCWAFTYVHDMMTMPYTQENDHTLSEC